MRPYCPAGLCLRAGAGMLHSRERMLEQAKLSRLVKECAGRPRRTGGISAFAGYSDLISSLEQHHDAVSMCMLCELMV